MKVFKVIILLAAIPAAASDIPGVWRISGSVAGQTFTSVCNLKQQGEKVTGTCNMEGEQPVDVVGSIKDGEARVSWDDGWHDAIRKVGSKYEKFAYSPGKLLLDTPANVTEARAINAPPI